LSIEAAALRRLKVLLAEDEPRVARLLRLILEDLGVQVVHTAADGAQALQFLGDHPGEANTLICDWYMPRVTGIELLRQVRSVDSAMPFVMITGQATAQAVMQARSLQVDAFIAKPFHLEVVGERLALIADRLRA
jgi:CheY-like chemotaxis protein